MRRIALYIALPFVALWCWIVHIIAGKHEHPALDPDAPIPYRLGTFAEPENTDRTINLALAINDVATEIMSARAKWPAFNSAHEGYAVALEEVD